MSPIVSVVEDHPVYRDTLCTVVAASDEWILDGVAASAEEAIVLLEDGHQPDVLLVDLSLPGMSGIDLVRVVGERWPGVRCLILSGHARRSYADEALAGGAKGYVLKGAPRQLREAIRAVLAGGQYVSEALLAAGPDELSDA